MAGQGEGPFPCQGAKKRESVDNDFNDGPLGGRGVVMRASAFSAVLQADGHGLKSCQVSRQSVFSISKSHEYPIMFPEREP